MDSKQSFSSHNSFGKQYVIAIHRNIHTSLSFEAYWITAHSLLNSVWWCNAEIASGYVQVSQKTLFLVIYNCWFLVKLHVLHVLLHWYILLILYLLLFNGVQCALVNLILLDFECVFYIVISSIFSAEISMVILAWQRCPLWTSITYNFHLCITSCLLVFNAFNYRL